MPGFPKALLVSAAAHALLAAALCICLDNVRQSPALDLSAVEISFADADSAETPPSLPSPTPPEESVPPPEPPPPPPQEESVPLPEPPPPPPQEESVPLPEPPPPQPQEESVPPPEPPPPPPQEESVPLPETAPKQAKIDAPPRPVKSIRPDYPKTARQRGEEGDVVLALSIDERGRVNRAEVAETSGFAELDDAAVRAAERARFVPAKSGRTSVSSTARITITFRLK